VDARERAADPAAAEAARRATFAVFAVNGFLFANWIPRIAEVRDRLGASEGRMGLALLAVAAGALVAMPLVGPLADRIGSRAATVLALVPFCAAFLPVIPADGLASLAAALFLVGAASGALDVSMNLHGAEVERAVGRPVFASFHGGFSLGAFAGAGTAALAAAAGLGMGVHFLLAAGLSAAVAAWAAPRLLRDRPHPPAPLRDAGPSLAGPHPPAPLRDAGPSLAGPHPPAPLRDAGPSLSRPPAGRGAEADAKERTKPLSRPAGEGGARPGIGRGGRVRARLSALRRWSAMLWAFAVVAFAGLLAEGAVADWSAILMADVHDAGTVAAGAAFAAFSAAMAAGRLTGDRVIARHGRRAVAAGGAALAAAGLVGAVCVPSAWGAVAMFALVGLGASCLFPATLAAAAEAAGRNGGAAIAAVSTVGYLAFLAGPPAIGFLAEFTGLSAALAAVAGLLLLVVPLSSRYRRTA
jgi:MFS family permease